MDIILIKFIEILLLPPGLMIVMLVAGWLLAGRFRILGRFLMFAGVALLWLASTPLVADWAIGLLEDTPALKPQELMPPRAQAIVLMGGGRNTAAPEYAHRDVPNRYALERIRYTAHLYRHTGLPILVTGGRVFDDSRPSEAELIRDVLHDDYRIPVQWLETDSRNSRENAEYSRRLLAPLGIDRIYLVTHAYHMPRSRRAFEAVGFTVIPAPTAYLHSNDQDLPLGLRLLPGIEALRVSTVFMHEVLGMVWYAVRY
ncbi:MAG TPA: YdcF family protein [Gammaproteobacteria bacterium]|nr:YdcF family protein [Gammaproteobacteria bacterium]